MDGSSKTLLLHPLLLRFPWVAAICNSPASWRSPVGSIHVTSRRLSHDDLLHMRGGLQCLAYCMYGTTQSLAALGPAPCQAAAHRVFAYTARIVKLVLFVNSWLCAIAYYRRPGKQIPCSSKAGCKTLWAAKPTSWALLTSTCGLAKKMQRLQLHRALSCCPARSPGVSWGDPLADCRVFDNDLLYPRRDEFADCHWPISSDSLW